MITPKLNKLGDYYTISLKGKFFILDSLMSTCYSLHDSLNKGGLELTLLIEKMNMTINHKVLTVEYAIDGEQFEFRDTL